MSNKDEENYLDNLLKNVMEPHPVQPRERETVDVGEQPVEELTEDSTIEMKQEEATDFTIDDLEPEPIIEEAVIEEEPELESVIEEAVIEEEPEPEPVIEEAVIEEEPEPVIEESVIEEGPEPIIEESVNEEEPEPVIEEAVNEEEPEPVIEEAVIEEEPEPKPESVMEEAVIEESEMEPVTEKSIMEELTESEPIMEPDLELADFSLDDLEEAMSSSEPILEQPMEQASTEGVSEGDMLDLDALEKELLLDEPDITETERAEMPDTEFDFDSLEKTEKMPDTQEITIEEPLPSTKNLDSEEDDFSDVLDLLNDDSDLAEINDLLKKSDHNEPVQDDMMDILNQMADDEEKQFAEEKQENKQIEESQEVQQQKAAVEESAQVKKSGKAKKAKAVKKQKNDSDDTGIEKKPGFFTKLFNVLTEEFEPEPTEEELAKEAEEKAAAKKEAMTKKEEEKKAKEEEKKAKDAEKEAAKKAKAEAAEQKKKERQVAKEAKLAEKRAKEEAQAPKKQKRISPKKLVLVTIFAVSVLAGVLLFTNMVSENGSLQRARKAYYDGNYQTVFIETYGSQLEESDAIVQARSKIILKMQRKYDSYVNHLKMGQEVEALNALIQGLGTYDSIWAEAEQYGVIAEVDEIKNNIVNILNANYGLDEAQARELLQNEDEITYTKSLNHIIMGDKSDLVSNSDMMQKAE